jgi:hypothetical protein
MTTFQPDMLSNVIGITDIHTYLIMHIAGITDVIEIMPLDIMVIIGKS